ncbi:MAG: peptidoglycan DD-metalloendopeptidase family protein [Maricaulaceae bacterium]|jgi:LysM repeat protein
MIRLAFLFAPLALLGCAASTPAPVDYRGGGAPISARSQAAAQPAPAAQAAAPAREVERGREIVVPAGATLYQISEEHRVSLRGLIDANGLEPPFRLSAGQTLALPPPNTYTVQPGDTLFGIARAHRVQPRSLALLNGMSEPYLIAPGDEIELPGSARDWRASAAGSSSAGAGVAASTSSGAAPATPRAPRGPDPAGPAPRFAWPAAGNVIDGFGPKEAGRRNDGVNIAANAGDPVVAAADGLVVYAGSELAGYGNLILVKHADGWVSAYAHNEALLVEEEQTVTQGQAIARAGSSGAVDAPQLHFELRRNGQPVDPAGILPRRG